MKCSVGIASINLALFLILMAGNVCGQQKSHSFYEFPPLYKFDDYDSCLAQTNQNNPPTYCMVYAEIKPKNSSEMWHQMLEYYEESPFRYRHDHLFFGVCMAKCKKFVNTTERNKLTDDDLIKNEITDYFAKVHKRPLDKQIRAEYHALIHNCLNDEFQQKYDLNLRTFIEYCERPKEFIKDETKDPLTSLLYKIIGIIVILNILSTLYDFCLKLQQPEENQNNDFYKINPQQAETKLLTSFSLCRNYYRLIQPCFSDIDKDFRFLDGFRSVCMIIAVYAHTNLCEYQHIANPQYFEKSDKDINKMWILNVTMVIEINFVMSGLFLFFKLQQGRYVAPQTNWKEFIFTYVRLMAYRFIRFLPSVGLLILVNATILTHLQNGPFWRHITEPLRVFSRERGWRNLLLINNFSHKESASHHTWYISADFQLYIFYLFVIMIVAKYPKYKKHIFSALIFLSFVIPFSITYLLKLHPCFVVKPESYRYTFFKDIDVYIKVYTKSYSNLFGYLFGIICGEIYLKYTRTEQVRKFVREKPIYTVAVCLVVIVAIFLAWLGVVLVVREPSLWSAIYAGLHRNLWIIFVCGGPLLLMSCNCGWIAYEFCCLPIFRVLARLSFQVYIWHMTIVYVINGYQRQPYYVNYFNLFSQFIILYFVSIGVAFMLALLVEYPIAQLVQVLYSSSNKRIKKS